MSGRAILLLEADDEAAAALVGLLEGDGYPVVTARSLFQAEDQARRHKPALLLVNVLLGQRALDPMELEGLVRVARCPVVTLGPRGRDDLGPSRYVARAHIERPIALEALLDVVRQHFHVGRDSQNPNLAASSGAALLVELRAGALWLSGSLDERATPEAMLAPLEGRAAGPLKVDCAQIGRVNSTGVRMWMQFLRALQRRGFEPTLRALCPVLVAHAKLIDGILAGCKLESFLCAVECESCQAESHVLVEAHAGALPEVACACGGRATTLDDPSGYGALFTAASR